jgi:hypothetical protein
MNIPIAALNGAVLTVCLLCVAAVDTSAQVVFSEENYQMLADGDSAETIPVGTWITPQNWQHTRNSCR